MYHSYIHIFNVLIEKLNKTIDLIFTNLKVSFPEKSWKQNFFYIFISPFSPIFEADYYSFITLLLSFFNLFYQRLKKMFSSIFSFSHFSSFNLRPICCCFFYDVLNENEEQTLQLILCNIL